jgi:two-component system cell cycle response regulator
MKRFLARTGPEGHPAVGVFMGVGVVGLILHALHTSVGLGGAGLDHFFNDWEYSAVSLIAVAACLLRGILVEVERPIWFLIGAGVLSWAGGDLYWNFKLAGAEDVPYPSVADAFYLAGYPALYAGMLFVARARYARFQTSLWLDGVIGALAVSAVGAALLYPAFQGATHADVAAVAVNLAYPLADILLLAFAVGAFALTGWRPSPGMVLFGGGLAITALADGIYLYQETTSGYIPGAWFDSLWLAGMMLIGVAAWTLRLHPSPVHLEGRRVLVMPFLFGLAAVGIEVYDQFRPVSNLAVGLATLTLVMVIVRMVFTFEENLQLLAMSRRDSLTDPLTTLGNRRRLLIDLAIITEAEARVPPHIFALFDLDGFKAYNDTFGHPAGDALLARLGRNLEAAVQPYGRAYRLGGDEFCALVPLGGRRANSIIAAASAALTEEADLFNIGNSRGVVSLPQEAVDGGAALKLADQRMYAQKSRRPRSPERQTRNVLLRVLREREPKLGQHLEGVAKLSVALGQALELEAEELDLVARAAELHDVGKMAIPDDVLTKPGPLNDLEWELIRKHTITGERILASAPAMTPVAKVVRATHERWDGAGYPDGLAYEQIPLGARIIAVCDSYEAMIEDRPWRAPKSEEQALAELRRCSGSQFDPRLVRIFLDKVYPQFAPEADDEPESETVIVLDDVNENVWG